MPTMLRQNGYYDLPPGKVAAIVTYLEMTVRPAPRPGPLQPDLALVPTLERSLDQHRELFRRVGRDWLWFSRLVMPDDELRAILSRAGTEGYELHRSGTPVGMLELARDVDGEVEIAFFGLVAEAVGKGVGRWLMERALELAWRDGPRRVWLHTCTFDHPDALAFYQRSGFRAYSRAIEVADDPRLTGHLPREVSTRTPLIG